MAKRKTRTMARERFDHIYRTIRERICLLDYPPSSRISEEEIAAEFCVSRTPIRRVMSRLEAEGLVESRVGFGTLVTDLDFEGLAAVYSLRMELAELIGRLDPLPPTDALIARCKAIDARCEAIGSNPSRKDLAHLNMEFFGVISACTGNVPLREISERLYFLSTRTWLASVPEDRLPEEVALFRREVSDIAEALALGDVLAAAHIRRSHISMSYRRIQSFSRQRELS